MDVNEHGRILHLDTN